MDCQPGAQVARAVGAKLGEQDVEAESASHPQMTGQILKWNNAAGAVNTTGAIEFAGAVLLGEEAPAALSLGTDSVTASTGRTAAQGLTEQLAMKQVKSNSAEGMQLVCPLVMIQP